MIKTTCKQGYCQEYFKENKKNSKKTWKGIYEVKSYKKSKKDSSASAIITNGSNITDPAEGAESFNNFFTSN